MRHILIFLFVLLTISCSDNSLRLGVTTTLEDSGLLTPLVFRFEQEHDMTIKPIVTGSGHLFSLLKRGDLDIAISHEPFGEQQLLDEGYISQRLPVFFNYFLLVGHTNNPAKITPTDSITQAFQKIHDGQHLFVSRADHSGTHRAEQRLWQPITQNKQPYIIRTGAGMGATLHVAIDKQAYTLVDLGTWLNFSNKSEHEIIWGKSHTLLNDYHLLIVNTEKIAHTHHQNVQKFKQWLLHKKTQQFIRNYQKNNQTIFFTESP